MLNQSPGSPALSVLSFKSGFHGRLFGSLSATRSKAIHKVDIPAFDWPCAPFPERKYPLAENVEFNDKEEKRCLEEYERILIESYVHVSLCLSACIHTSTRSISLLPLFFVQDTPDGKELTISKPTRPVAAVIIEPVLAEGGDKHASDAYFRQLRLIAKTHGAYFIVDEVQTGVGATGKFWAHEHWGLKEGEEPDFVTFSKKMQASGIYHKKELRPNQAYRIYGTWMVGLFLESPLPLVRPS